VWGERLGNGRNPSLRQHIGLEEMRMDFIISDLFSKKYFKKVCGRGELNPYSLSATCS
jgi:hypothetical protein